MSRRPPSVRSTVVWSTMLLAVVVTAVLVSHYRDDPAYRNGSAPELHGVVVSTPMHRHMTCGRSANGYQVLVSYSVHGAVRTEPLPTCSPRAYPRGTFVDFWEQRPDLLTTTAPDPESHLLPWTLAGLGALWGLVVGLAVWTGRRSARGADLVGQ